MKTLGYGIIGTGRISVNHLDAIEQVEGARARLRTGSQPVLELGLSDEEDGWVALTDGRLVAARVPRGRLELIEKCGHFPHYEHPAEYLQTLEEFLAASR